MSTHPSVIGLNGHIITSTAKYGKTATSIAFHPKGLQFASGGTDGIARLWNLNGELIAEFECDPGEHIWDIAFSPNGKLLATESWGGLLRIFNLETGEIDDLQTRFTPDDEICKESIKSFSFSPNSKYLVTTY